MHRRRYFNKGKGRICVVKARQGWLPKGAGHIQRGEVCHRFLVMMAMGHRKERSRTSSAWGSPEIAGGPAGNRRADDSYVTE